MPKVSVVMPVYNGEKYLREAIDSILNQTFSDFEFIILNDASKDSTEEIIKSYNDDRIVYLKNEKNLGVAGTLNRGVNAAKGDYIARMDADDISLPERFQKQVDFMESHPEVGVCGSNIIVFSDVPKYTSALPCSYEDIRLQLFFSSQLAHPTVMARRILVQEGFYNYDTHWEGREDYELWTRLIQKTRICNISEPLLKYRNHEAQVTQQKKEGQLENHAVLKYKFLNEMGIAVSMDEATIFSKYCVGINEYTLYEFKIFRRILQEIGKKYKASPKFLKNIQKRITIKEPEKSAYIITCHDVYNYGASLQAYALQTYLEKCNIDINIIDYQAPYLSKLFDFKSVPEKYNRNIILKWLFQCYLLKVYMPAIPKFFRYKKFNKKCLRLTSKKYKNNEELKSLKSADMYFCGSDQIWNSYNYSCGKDPAFFLDFAPENASKFSYAASFGGDKIDESYSQFTNEMLRGFEGISVREKSGQEILKHIGIDNAELVCDPVFLLSENEWVQLAKGKEEKPYVLIYAFDNKEKAQEIAREIADKDGLEIKDFSYGNKEYASGPLEFLHLIQNAQTVVTNSFHAIAFSLIFQKQFWVVNRDEKGLSERLDNILNIAKLTERKVDNVKDIVARNEENIDYSEKITLIEEFVNCSKQYIERCIEIEQGKNR